MSRLLIVVGDAHPTGELLAEAGQALGIDVSLVDLRRQQLSIRLGADTHVSVDREPIATPAVVVNVSGVNGLGLTGADGLLRQRSSRWLHRHVGAREEQGLLLAVLAHFRRQGSILVNGPEAADLALMPNVVIDRLHRSGIPFDGAAAKREGCEILVAGGRGIIHTGTAPTSEQIRVALAVAHHAQFNLGSVLLRAEASGTSTVAGWEHQPRLSDWPQSQACASEILRSYPSLECSDTPRVVPPFFVEDLTPP